MVMNDVPILFISAMDDDEGRMAVYGHGGQGYLSKPFRIEEVLARVDMYVELRCLRLDVTQSRHFMEVFASLNDEMESASTEKAMLNFARSALIDILSLDSVQIHGLSKTNANQLTLGMHVGSEHDEGAHDSVEFGRFLGEILEQGASVVGYRDAIERDSRWEALMRPGFSAVMITPSQTAGRTLAVFTLSAKDESFFTPARRRIVEQIAQQLALYLALRREE